MSDAVHSVKAARCSNSGRDSGDGGGKGIGSADYKECQYVLWPAEFV